MDRLTGVTAQDEINLTAAFINVVREQSTVLGAAPTKMLEDPIVVAICHRWVLSHAAWERAHLDRTGYFDDHPRAFG